jgi:release factor glutamine methyltransferase
MEVALATATYAELLRDGETQLCGAGISTARLDAELLLAMAMSTDRAGLFVRLRQTAADDVARRFGGLIDRRARREPLAYITGVQEFWSLPFAVTPAVLIPRPETELLVEVVCRLVRAELSTPSTPILTFPREGGRDPEGSALERSDRELWICDVGTGSGCIAIALARELPGARIVATDMSADALAVAAANAESHGVGERIAFARGDLFAALAENARFDVVVSNPPYLAPGDAVSPELAFEPRGALAADMDGLRVIRRLIAAAPDRLRSGGWLVMELGHEQAARAQALAHAAGWSRVSVEPDLAGIPRALVAQRGPQVGTSPRRAPTADE